MREFIDERIRKQTEEKILQVYKEEFSTFNQKCQIGENDSYICSLIRSDSVEEFIAYVNRTNLSLLTKIKPTIYETNSFLIDKEPTLIEYSAFFGSIQIIQYLKYNKVQLTSSLWFYAIHSNNAELIHFLEENEIKLEKKISKNKFYKNIFIESVKCHHNEIANYIKDNFLNKNIANDQNSFNSRFGYAVCDSLNFFFFPNEIESVISNSGNEKGFNLHELLSYLTTITKITIPSSATKIGNNAFSRCSSLIQMIIPSSVTRIGNYVFSDCLSLVQISIPSSVTEIGDGAFRGIVRIEIIGNIKRLPNQLFLHCIALKQITIPSSVTEIGTDAFRGCSSLAQITIPSSVTSIGNYSFQECSSLKQIIIPSSVTEIGDNDLQIINTNRYSFFCNRN